MKINKTVTKLMAQLGVWACITLMPSVIAFLTTKSQSAALQTFGMLWFNLQSPFLLYFINYYLLWPLLFAKRRYAWFVIANLILFFLFNPGLLHLRHFADHGDVHMPDRAWMGFFSGLFVYFLLNCASVVIAVVQRHLFNIRKIRQQLEEERHKNTEAELAWLKNQINPHFLFNTLNNISSLTQIDSNAAQDAIAQLSDLLRYAIYKTDEHMVPIRGEVEFMRNYIELMRLRCNEKTQVDSHFSIKDPEHLVAPLLFISLIENAFKHGVSSNKPSSIDISLQQEEGMLQFTCSNTNYPKSDSDRSGSGIGVENTKRRLQLVYGDHYEWKQTLEDNIYTVIIRIQT